MDEQASRAPPLQAPAAAAARHTAVDGHAGGDPAAARRRTRRASRQVLAQSAERSASAQLPLLGWLVLALIPARLWLEGAAVLSLAHGLWLLGCAALASTLLGWPHWRPHRRVPGRLPGHQRGVSAPARVALAAAASLVAAWPAAGSTPAAGWAVVVGTFAVVAVAALAASVPAATAAAAAPLLAWSIGAWAAGPGDPGPMLWATALAVGLGWRLHLRWRQQTLRAVEQSDKLQTLESERDAAQRNDSDKSRFLAIASHDLRQPVHALGLFAATLHKRLMNSPDEPLGRNLMRSVDSLERSFNAMLDISRLDGGAVSPRVQSFPLRDLFRRLHMQYAGQAELAGLGLRFSPGGKSVASDPQLLERIVGNLVQNAIRYTTQGGIVVVARTTSTHVNIEVWDSGCGIQPEELPRIFDEFYQVGRGERDRSQGLGMGLAIVKRLAALLQHRLEVVSTPGRGTLFRLGVQLGQLDGLDEETAAADTVPMSVDLPQMVLVVDDEEPIREGLRVLLQEWGYQVIAAADAAQAERAVSALEGRIDLILTDLHLGPGPGGQEVVATVRRLCGREVPALLVTGDTAGEALKAVAAGADPVLFKPVQPRHLFEAMRAALERPGSPPV